MSTSLSDARTAELTALGSQIGSTGVTDVFGIDNGGRSMVEILPSSDQTEALAQFILDTYMEDETTGNDLKGHITALSRLSNIRGFDTAWIETKMTERDMRTAMALRAKYLRSSNE